MKQENGRNSYKKEQYRILIRRREKMKDEEE